MQKKERIEAGVLNILDIKSRGAVDLVVQRCAEIVIINLYRFNFFIYRVL